jgi:site-specific recombinase XerD
LNDYINEAPALLKDFLGYMQTVKGKSPATVDEYYSDLRTFFRYLKKMRKLVPGDMDLQEISISDIDLDFIKSITLTDIYIFMDYAMRERGNNAATRARKTSSIRSFFHYLTNKKCLLSINPAEELEVPKKKKALPKFLTLEQSLELLNAVDGNYKERDYCIITLFLNCGIRLSELTGLNYSDVHIDERTMKVTGKGNKERIIYLNDACIDAIRQYLKVRPVDGVIDKKALFISRQNRRMSPKTVQAMVYKYLEKIGLDSNGYSVHKLRHTAATLMYQHGNVDIRVLKEILGHENLGTTEIYTHLTSSHMERAANASPLAHVKPKTKKDSGNNGKN